jgi:hypothetical protein
MHPWERRLADLSRLLASCGETYFAPDLFRQNTNQFLQTSRTVTFIIQKHKAEIPDFDVWYKSRVLTPWGTDVIMNWAKDARNFIEKEGDLEMHSSLRASAVFSHRASEDVVLSITRVELLKANLDRLMHFARTKLPPALADGAVLKIERRWVANSLPSYELISAMTYAYSRIYEVCVALTHHLGDFPDKSLPHPTSLDPVSNDVAMTRFIRVTKRKPEVGRLKSVRIKADPDFRPPPALMKLKEEFKIAAKPINVDQTVTMLAKIAVSTFEHYGHHIPMLYLYNEKWEQIDGLSAHFVDQAEKFIFWRHAAERAAYLRAYGVVWICESWIRDLAGHRPLPMRKLPIIGERLNVIGSDVDGQTKIIAWDIRRANAEAKPTLELHGDDEEEQSFFLEPVLAAMKAVRVPRP